MSRVSRWRGSFFGFQSPGYQLALAAVDRYERMVGVCALKPENERCYRAQIDKIRDALEQRIWYLIPYPRYDLTWAELYSLRNEFCQALPLDRVVGELVEEIFDDLGYLDDAGAKTKREELQAVRNGMLAVLGGKGDEASLALPTRLRALSQLAAQARNAHWLKVNMTRNRLAMMGVATLLVLLMVLAELPPGLREPTEPLLELEHFYWLILFFGALGGILSAIMDNESVDTRASEYYINRRLLYLRPLVGAALALVIYLALKTKPIAIKGVGTSILDPSYLVIAFVSGFAERFFVGQLLKVVGVSDANGGGAPAPKPTNGK